MFISSNNLLNILIPNDNKVLKEALKEADSKTLEQMVKNNSGSVNDVLKNLFENLKNGTKSNASIENMLKNTSALKDLGNVSTNLSNLLESVSKDESLQKFKPMIESFLKNIKDMDANTLKEQAIKFKVDGVLKQALVQSRSQGGALVLIVVNSIEKDFKDDRILMFTKYYQKLFNNTDYRYNGTKRGNS